MQTYMSQANLDAATETYHDERQDLAPGVCFKMGIRATHGRTKSEQDELLKESNMHRVEWFRALGHMV